MKGAAIGLGRQVINLPPEPVDQSYSNRWVVGRPINNHDENNTFHLQFASGHAEQLYKHEHSSSQFSWEVSSWFCIIPRYATWKLATTVARESQRQKESGHTLAFSISILNIYSTSIYRSLMIILANNFKAWLCALLNALHVLSHSLLSFHRWEGRGLGS